MTDFWEILGRMIASDPLRNGFFGNAAITGARRQPVTGGFRYDVAAEQAFRSFLSSDVPNLEHGPVSLYAIGEFIRVATIQGLEGDLQALENRARAGLGVNLDSRSGRFYSCLGALTVDSEFAGLVAGGPAQAFGGPLTANDVADLAMIARDDQQPGSYGEFAAALCGRSWQPDCGVRLLPYADAIQVGVGHPVLVRPLVKP